MALAISSWVQPSGHSPRSFRLAIGVDSFWPCGSAGLSPRPTPDTTDFTPGTLSTSLLASFSSLIDSSSEILGTRSIAGTIEPSFISGMNEVPSSGTIASVATKAATAQITVLRLLPSAQCSRRR
ncbi:hypothetical protein D9M72_207310 [compost metagenome]